MTGVFLVDRQEFFNRCTLDFRSGGRAKHVSIHFFLLEIQGMRYENRETASCLQSSLSQVFDAAFQ